MKSGKVKVVAVTVVIVVAVLALAYFLSMRKELTLTEMIFCSEQPGDRNYEVQPDATYQAGDNIYMYLEASNFGTAKLNDEYEIHLTVSMKLFDAAGNVLTNWPDLLESHPVVEEIPDHAWFCPRIFQVEPFPAGRYAVEITVKDHISAQTKRVRGNFYIE